MNDQTKHDGQQRLPNPVAWVRFCSDGGIEGPILDSDSRMDGVRRTSGAWTPLYTAKPQPVNQQMLAAHERIAKLEEELTTAAEWRRLALQFDNHRIEAIAHLRCLLENPESHAAAANRFLCAPPMSGEQVLAERVAAIAAAEAAQPEADECLHEFVPFCGECVKCGEPYIQQPASAQPVAVPDGYAQGVEAVAKMLEKKADDFASENGYDDMGSLSFGGNLNGELMRDYHSGLLELAEEVRAMKTDCQHPASSQPVAVPDGYALVPVEKLKSILHYAKTIHEKLSCEEFFANGVNIPNGRIYDAAERACWIENSANAMLSAAQKGGAA